MNPAYIVNLNAIAGLSLVRTSLRHKRGIDLQFSGILLREGEDGKEKARNPVEKLHGGR